MNLNDLALLSLLAAPVHIQMPVPVSVSARCGVNKVNNFIVSTSIIVSKWVVRELGGVQMGRKDVCIQFESKKIIRKGRIKVICESVSRGMN